MQRELRSWLDDQLAAPVRELEPPPPLVADYLERHHANLERLVGHLRSSDPPPRWEVAHRLEFMDSMQEGNYIGQIKLQELLTGHALVLAAAGDDLAALEVVRQGWRLNSNLYEGLDQICGLVAIQITKYHLGALRKIAGAGPQWLEDAEPVTPRDAVRTGFVYTTWALREIGLRGGREAVAGLYTKGSAAYRWHLDRLMNPLIRYIALSEVELAPALLAAAPEFDLFLDDPTWIDSVPADRPPWVGSLKLLSLGTQWARAELLELDFELTRRVLELREHRRRFGDWPESLAEPGVLVGPGRRWAYQALTDGSMQIALDGEPPWQPDVGLVLPLDHRE